MANGVKVIEGRAARKRTTNALRVDFQDGPGDPFASALQAGGDGTGKKLGVLFGFKNGGVGTHVLTFADGTELTVESKDLEPSVFSRADGTAVVTVTRGATSTAVGSDGRTILTFTPDSHEPKTLDLFRMHLSDGAGLDVGRLDVVRRNSGFTVTDVVDALEEVFWWQRPGQPLKLPILGTRATLSRDLTPLERDVLLGACVDITIGLRPYISAMN
jgi:hypothetical protein